jgi:NADPH-dependent 2,4-dienoyl-CoA reductase/sulfur reductase-like enzyme
VVVIGGGAGGVTAAKYIAKDSAARLPSRWSSRMPNIRPASTAISISAVCGIILHHPRLRRAEEARRHGRRRPRQQDRPRQEGSHSRQWQEAAYDRLVVSPGIDLKYDSVPGWSQAAEEKMPHAWKPGAQTLLLKKKLDAVPNGGVIVMIAPPNPYRCPPGPYERVSMMAHALKKAGRPAPRLW